MAKQVLKVTDKAMRREVKHSKAYWFMKEAYRVGASIRGGNTRPLWNLARKLTKGQAAHYAVAVVKGEQGQVLETKAEVTALWERTFLAEFSGLGQQVSEETWAETVAEVPFDKLEEHEVPSVASLRGRLVDALWRSSLRKAVGEDSLP